MIAGRPARIVLAAAALVIVGVVTVVGVVGPTIASLLECGSLCSLQLDVPTILRLGTPLVAVALAAGPLFWPASLVRPAAVLSGLLAIGWIGLVAQESSPAPVLAVALGLLAATPFLVVTPYGPDTGRWPRRLWIAVILAALALWLLDMSFSGFMQTNPVPPQLAFLGVAAVVLGAGLASGALRRREPGVASGLVEGREDQQEGQHRSG